LAAVIIGNSWCDHEFVIIATAIFVISCAFMTLAVVAYSVS